MKYILFILFIILFGSCTKSSDDEFIVNLDNDMSISLFDVFSKVEVVELETIEESLFRNINQIVYFNNKYYILDRSSFSIFVFDNEGKFTFKIANIGDGPEEYVYISSFAVDQKNSLLYLVDGVKYELNCYDTNGRFIKKIQLPKLTHATYENMYILNQDLIVFSSLSKDGRIIYYSIPDQRVVGKYLPENHKFESSPYRITNAGKYVRSFSNEVYSLAETGPILDFVWNFGLENNEDELKIQGYSPQERKSFYERLQRSEVLEYLLVNQLSNRRYNYAKVLYKGGYLNIFYDNINKDYALFDQFKEGVDIYPGYMIDDFMIGVNTHTPEVVPILLDAILDKEQQVKLINLDYDNNPILVKYYFK